MSDIRFIIYLVITLFISLFIIIAKPEMHKQAIITDSSFEFAEIVMQPAEIKPSEVPVSVKTVPSQTQKVVTSNQGNTQRPISTVTQTTKTSAPKQQKVVNNKISQPIATPKQTTQPKQTTTKKQESASTSNKNTPAQQQPKQVKVSQENPIQNTNKILTEQEEIIAWNRWRSRLQNQTMMDTKLAAPLGTQFKFSFTVDKYGNLSNVKVWSTNPAYSDMAVRAIKPVLMSYRNKPILNFPEGTKRIITNVTGGFVISRTTEYSTPADYNDFERVRR